MRKLIFILMFATSLKAQTISPPVVSYSGFKTSDIFTIKNNSETAPLLVTGLSVETFTVDEAGNPTFVKLDPTKISLKLSENSARIPPSATHEFYVEMKCLQPGPCWACVYASVANGRTANGIAVTLLLPHTIYLGQGSVKRKEAEVNFIDKTSFKITNDGNGLDRPQVEIWTAAGKSLSGVPLFPHYSRLVTSDLPIERIKIKFTKFTIDEKH
jgi:hypothetical protein